jgi:hypothetical protein
VSLLYHFVLETKENIELREQQKYGRAIAKAG